VLWRFFNGEKKRNEAVESWTAAAQICCAKRLPAADYARNKRGSSRQRYSYRSQLKTSAAVPNRRWCLCSATGIEKVRLMR